MIFTDPNKLEWIVRVCLDNLRDGYWQCSRAKADTDEEAKELFGYVTYGYGFKNYKPKENREPVCMRQLRDRVVLILQDLGVRDHNLIDEVTNRITIDNDAVIQG